MLSLQKESGRNNELFECFENFRNECMDKSTNQDATTCKHDAGIIEKLAMEIRNIQNQNKIGNIELTYLEELINEIQ